MSILSEMKKKYQEKRVATATPATPATHEEEWRGKVAEVATVAVANPWEGEIEEAANDSRQQRVEDMLISNPELKYAVVVDDANTDPVSVTVGIRKIAVFDLEIPRKNYDGMALLQVIEQYAEEAGNTHASTEGRKHD